MMRRQIAAAVLACALAACARDKPAPPGSTVSVSFSETPESAMRFDQDRVLVLMSQSADLFEANMRENGADTSDLNGTPYWALPERRLVVTVPYGLRTLNKDYYTSALRRGIDGSAWLNEPAHGDMVEFDKKGDVRRRLTFAPGTSVADFRPLTDGSIVFSDRGLHESAIRLIPAAALRDTAGLGKGRAGVLDLSKRVKTLKVLDARSSPDELAECSDGQIWFVEIDDQRIGRIGLNGDPATFRQFSAVRAAGLHAKRSAETQPHSIAADQNRTCFFVAGQEHAELYRIRTDIAAIRGSREDKVFEKTDTDAAPRSGQGSLGLGPDGSLWLAEFNGDRVVRIDRRGRIHDSNMAANAPVSANECGSGLCIAEQVTTLGSTFGRVTIRDLRSDASRFIHVPNTNGDPAAITADEDKPALWFAERQTGRIGKVEPAQRRILEYRSPPSTDRGRECAGKVGDPPVARAAGAVPTFDGIAVTPRGAPKRIFVTEYGADRIATFDPNTKALREYAIHDPAGLRATSAGPEQIAADSDGNAWFTEGHANTIGYMRPCGNFLEYSITTEDSQPFGIVRGPDDLMWFTETAGNRIAKITRGGAITEYSIPTPNSMPMQIIMGRDRNLWFTEYNGNRIGRISTIGEIREYRLPRARSQPLGITASRDGVWFTETTEEPERSRVGYLTYDGTLQENTLAGRPFAIAAVAEGANDTAHELWITLPDNSSLLRLGY